MYYPMMYDLSNKKICIVGGGLVSFSKFKSLLDFGVFPTVISPTLNESFNEYKDKFIFINDYYKDEYIKNMDMVIAGTDIKTVNEQVLNYCRENKILINIVDKPDMCDFIVPAYVKRGSLTISISTEGKSPSLAKKIKKDLSKIYSEEYEQYLDILGDLRQKILSSDMTQSEKRKMIISLIEKNNEELENFEIK